jgi:hypothetical protein
MEAVVDKAQGNPQPVGSGEERTAPFVLCNSIDAAHCVYRIYVHASQELPSVFLGLPEELAQPFVAS